MTFSVLAPQDYQGPPMTSLADATAVKTLPLKNVHRCSFIDTISLPRADVLRAIGETVYPTTEISHLYKTNTLLARCVGAGLRDIDTSKIPLLRHQQELIAYFTKDHTLNYNDPGEVARISFKMHAETHRHNNPHDVKRGAAFRANDVPIGNQPSGHLLEAIQSSAKIICDDSSESVFPPIPETSLWDDLKRSVRKFWGYQTEPYGIPMGFESALKQQFFETIGAEMMTRIADGVLNQSMEDALAQSSAAEMSGRIIALPVVQEACISGEAIKFLQP